MILISFRMKDRMHIIDLDSVGLINGFSIRIGDLLDRL
jgi:hypothetical protein